MIELRVTRPIARLRAVAAWLAFIGVFGLVENVVGTHGRSIAFVITNVLSAVLALVAGVALWRGRRWAYPIALILFVVATIEGAIFFATFDHYSSGARLAAGLPVILLASMPIVVMLTRQSRAWLRGAHEGLQDTPSSSDP